jgi:hypothetical protein
MKINRVSAVAQPEPGGDGGPGACHPGEPDQAVQERGDQPLRGDVQVAVGLRHHARPEAGQGRADRRARPVHAQRAGEQQVPRRGGAGQVQRDQQRKRHGRPEDDGDRRQQHPVQDVRGIGHHVHPTGRIQPIGDETEVTGPDERAVGQEPLDERLVVHVGGQRPGLRIGPQPRRQQPRDHRVRETDQRVDRAGAAQRDPRRSARPGRLFNGGGVVGVGGDRLGSGAGHAGKHILCPQSGPSRRRRQLTYACGPDGGIGRHSRLKSDSRKACGFEPRSGHQQVGGYGRGGPKDPQPDVVAPVVAELPSGVPHMRSATPPAASPGISGKRGDSGTLARAYWCRTTGAYRGRRYLEGARPTAARCTLRPESDAAGPRSVRRRRVGGPEAPRPRWSPGRHPCRRRNPPSRTTQ